MHIKINPIVLIILLSIPIFAISQPLKLEWVVEYPCYAPGSLEYDKILTDNEQNVYLCGTAISDISPFLNGSAILTQKYDSTGNLLWQSKFDGPFGDGYYDSGIINNRIVIGGKRSTMPGALPSRAELVSYDINDGHTQWYNYLFDTIQQGANLVDIDLDNQDNIFAFGSVTSYVGEFDSNKMYVCKILQNSGEIEWMHIFQNEFAGIKGKVLNDRVRVYGVKVLGQFNSVGFLMDLDLDGNKISSVNLPSSLSFGPGIFSNYFFFDPEGFLIGFGYNIYKFGPNDNPVWAYDFSRGLPNKKGQARTAVSDEDGNIYATGYLWDTVTSESYTQTLKLSPSGELIWATVSDFPEPSENEYGWRMAVSDNHVFVCSTVSYANPGGNPASIFDYWNLLYSQENGSVVYDTLIDVNVQDYAYYVHYDRGHFYLLGRSYDPASSDQADYMYKLFKFGVEEPSYSNEKQQVKDLVQIFPNPTDGLITISQKERKVFNKVALFDVLGRRVFSRHLDRLEETLSLPSLPSGKYLLKLTGDNGAAHTEKLFVQGN